MTTMTRTIAALGIAAVAMTLGADNGASADEADIAQYFDEARTIDFYPKPWPLANLITEGTLTVGITARTPPGSFVNEQGEFDGSRIQLWQRIAEDLGLEIEFVRLDWPGILPGLTANRFDIACEGASWSTERLGSQDFLLTRPIITNATIGLVRTDSGIASWDDVSGKALGGVRGELYYESAQREVTDHGSLVDMPGRPEATLALLNRQMDVFAVDLVHARTLLEEHPRADELMIIGPPLDLLVASMCVNRRSPDLLVAVNLLLTNYRVDGTIADLEREYYGFDDHVQLLRVLGY